MPKMNLSQEFERALAIARITMQFGQVRRVTMHENGEHESDTTHTVMLTLLGIEMAPLAGCDPGLVAQFAAVHDLPETYAGDTNTARGLSPVEIEEKAGREALAMERLRDDLGDSPVLALLERYEAQEEPEARLVRYLDKVTPKLTHRLNRGRALAAMDLTTSDVREKHAMQGEQLARQYPELASVRRLFEEACAVVEANVLDDPSPRAAARLGDAAHLAALAVRLRDAADTYSESPPIFGLFFEAAEALDDAIKVEVDLAEAFDTLREQATKLSLSASLRGPDAGRSPSRHQGPAALLFFTAEYLRGHVARLARLKVEHGEANSKVAERLRRIMSTCFDGSRSGELAFQLADMEEWIPKFTSEWKSNHRRWLELCDRLGFDALDLGQRGRVAEVDAVAGDAFELRRIRALVDEDARKRHGNREGEPSWGVIADCVLAHVSQHRQETEAERQVLRCAEALGYVGEPDRLAIAVGDACLAFAKDLREINARYMVTIKRLEVEADETSQYLRDFEASLVSAGKWDAQPELPLNLLAREIVAQAERWRIDAEHYRSEASNATATMVESLSAEVAQLTGEVAATRAEANRQIETLRETANRKLGEMREHNKAHIMERDKARSENAALRDEVQMWRDRAESDRKRDVTRVEEFKSALAEALGEQALAYQAAGERKSHSLEVMRGIMRLELAMAEVLRSLARGEQKSNGKVEIIEPIADHDVERSEAPTRVFSADSSVEGLHRRLEEADIRLAGLQDESASLRLSLQEETRKVIEYSDLVDQYKMAMAQVQGASAAQIAAALNPSLGATTLRHTLAAQLRAAAKTASAWEEAAIREWAPLAPDYHDGDGTVAAAIEGPYIEHRLVMAWRGKVRRMADHLGADDSSSLPNYGEFGPNNTSEKLPRVIDTVTLSTIGALCRHFILITTADKQCPEGRAGRRLSVGLCRIVVEPTVNGPVINDVPDPNVAWSAYAYVHDVRVDLYGCGPTPTAALECLERDRQRKMERLKEVLRG